MGMQMKAGTSPGEFGILVRMPTGLGDLYCRMDALVSALGNLTPGSVLNIQPYSIIGVLSTQRPKPGPKELQEVRPGALMVELVEGASADDLVALLRGALDDGTVPDDWIIEISPNGRKLFMTHPVMVRDPYAEHVGYGRHDYPHRDRQFNRPERRGPKVTKVLRRTVEQPPD